MIYYPKYLFLMGFISYLFYLNTLRTHCIYQILTNMAKLVIINLTLFAKLFYIYSNHSNYRTDLVPAIRNVFSLHCLECHFM